MTMDGIKQYDTPWKHYIIDDFLHEEEFKTIQFLTKKWQRPRTQKEKFNLWLVDFKFYKETAPFHDEAMYVYDMLVEAMKNIEEQFDLKNKFKSYHVEYVNCGNDFYYPVHKDAVSKVFTNVFYVSENGDGTRLYKEKTGAVEKIVDWRPNRVVSFEPTDHSWHDYLSTQEDRISFNLCFLNFKKNNDSPINRVETDLTRI